VTKTIEDRAKATINGAIYRARRRFREENFVNPWGDHHYLVDIRKAAMARAYDDEIDRLINERICPCCGQPTRGDIDC